MTLETETENNSQSLISLLLNTEIFTQTANLSTISIFFKKVTFWIVVEYHIRGDWTIVFCMTKSHKLNMFWSIAFG